ncbi:MAG: FAD-dependent oxidoreductase [Acidobacteria bacterium]|nr:FAD-dependent oxidoreductase [Acidobacteriota bacterium]
MNDLKADILIVGGGVGGCAAARAACAAGLTVVMTEESDWIGGQFTSQATPPDEHGWIERFGCTRSYRRLRDRVREVYRERFPLTEAAAADPFLNPGEGWVSPLCAEPRVFLRVLEEMLAPFMHHGKLVILRETVAESAETNGDSVVSVVLRSLKTGDRSKVSAKYFLDATELGELLPLTGTEFVTGSESRAETGEPGAKETADPANSQAFSMCFAISHYAGEDHTIARPANYEFWRSFVPQLDPPWPGPLLSMEALNPRTLAKITYRFDPHREPNTAFAGLWTYRRILFRDNFTPGAFESDVTLVNYPQIDYLGGDLVNASRESRSEMLAAAKEQSLSFLYFLQTEMGFKGLKLRPSVVGTDDGLAKMPYIRESRRIRSVFTVREQHVSAACRPGERFAEKFDDSVGIGFYRIDLHPTAAGDNYVDVESLPFQIPLGALVPKRVSNLLPACKNIGTTHITNGCYRLHPVEWNIGEAAGELAVFCISREIAPKSVLEDRPTLRDFQARLRREGFELEWPEDLILEDGDPHRHAMRDEQS